MHEIARYTRRLPVSLERMFENALDWEHLPHLHRNTFKDATLMASAGDFWEARLQLRGLGGRTQVVRLTLDEEAGVWISDVRAGVSRGLQIHTTATAHGPRELTVDVRFHVPSRRPWNRLFGQRLVDTYRVLYDEDESMMLGRQAQLDRPAPPISGPVELGPESALRQPGFTFDKDGQRFGVTLLDGHWVAYSLRCPHWLGPLDRQPVVDGQVTCPWHGYRFDLRSLACQGHSLRLPRAPRLQRGDDGIFWA